MDTAKNQNLHGILNNVQASVSIQQENNSWLFFLGGGTAVSKIASPIKVGVILFHPRNDTFFVKK